MDTDAKMARLKGKLTKSMEAGQFYEAHQLYRTFFYRMVAAAKYEQVLDLLYTGAIEFYDRKQNAIAVDLSELFAETLTKASWPITDERTLDRVQDLFSRAPSAHTSAASTDDMLLYGGTCLSGTSGHAHASGTGEKTLKSLDEVSSTAIDRTKLFNSLLNWSKSVSKEKRGSERGDSRLHKRFAQIYWQEKRYDNARYHFLMSTDAEGSALFLIEFHTTRGYANEVDLFVAQIVFQYLCHSDKKTASAVFHQYTSSHPQIRQPEPPYKLPLLNFVWLLLLCIDLRQVTYYSVLVEKYQPSLKRDPSYHSYLDKIGQIFFGMPAPVKRQNGGFLQNILQGLLGGGSSSPGHSRATPPIELNSQDDDDFHSVGSDPEVMMEQEELD